MSRVYKNETLKILLVKNSITDKLLLCYDFDEGMLRKCCVGKRTSS